MRRRANSNPQPPAGPRGRDRANSDPLRDTTTGAVRPPVLYFYCDALNYDNIRAANAIWRSGGMPAIPHVAPGAAAGGGAAAAAAAAPAGHVGHFPAGAYASSSSPAVVRAGIGAFTQQWYGAHAPVLTHYVAFQNGPGWEPEGHNLTPNLIAMFGWHWVNQNANVQMTRTFAAAHPPLQHNSVQVAAVGITIVDHGQF